MKDKQTAVEWLFDNLNKCFEKFDNGEYSYTDFVNACEEVKKQSKLIEREQIEKAFNKGNKMSNSPFADSEWYYICTYVDNK